jgi:phosphate acetyltransferase
LAFFGDCAVIPNPDSQQLADIAEATSDNFKAFTGKDSKTAMLSFSTKGSAETDETKKVAEAVKILKERRSDLNVDGEMQFDAALVPEVGAKKAPGSTVAGQANVLIFPTLDAGNIGYKIAQRYGNAEALGPILQGANHPVNDLSRGCNVQDIVNVIAITSVQV